MKHKWHNRRFWLSAATLFIAFGTLLGSALARIDIQKITTSASATVAAVNQSCAALDVSAGHQHNQIHLQAPKQHRQVANNSHDEFSIDSHEVTNAQFAEFITATGYQTIAERQPLSSDYPDIEPELLVPGSAVFIAPDVVQGDSINQWWQFVPGANWRQPQGPGSHIKDRQQHPVVHIAYADALAYASWRGRALPSEAQWQLAAAYAESADRSVWHETANGRPAANIWNGLFPIRNTGSDGFAGLAPVGCFPASAAGLHDMIGNVWEWVSDPYTEQPQRIARLLDTPVTTSAQPTAAVPMGTIKGGSFLCSANFCMNYRPEARLAQDTSMGTDHLGFRTVSAPAPDTASNRVSSFTSTKAGTVRSRETSTVARVAP